MHRSRAMLQGVLQGSLIWSPDGPRPVESIGVGDPVVLFDPASFTTATAPIREIRSARVTACLELSAGGRPLAVAADQRLPLFDIDGKWSFRPAGEVTPDHWLPVDRRVPPPAQPLALPDRDRRLTRLLGEDALALADSLFVQDCYFAEMDKRGLRLKLYELSGYILAGGQVLGEHLTVDEADATAMTYYAEVWRRTFGVIVQEETTGEQPVSSLLQRWMGEGLLAEPERTVPSWAWRLESQARAAFLRGFFDLAGTVTEAVVSVTWMAPRLLVELQVLLGSLGVEARVEADDPGYRLSVRNVRRFAEWISSNVPNKAARLEEVYRREPRYPSEGNAILPLNRVRPALARIRAMASFARPPAGAGDEVDSRELASLDTLRLLATAFDEPQLREMVNRQLYLEPLARPRVQKGGTIFALSLPDPGCVVANGLIVCTYSPREL